MASNAAHFSDLASTLGRAGMELYRNNWSPEARQRQKTDDIANNLMTRHLQDSGEIPIPRAEAVDPDMESRMRQMYPERSTQAPERFTGGAEGAREVLALEGAMDSFRQRDIVNALNMGEATRAQERHEALYGPQARAAAALKLESDKSRQAFGDAMKYQTQLRALMREITSATENGDKNRYDAAVDMIEANYTSAVSAGLKDVLRPTIPAFVTPEERQRRSDMQFQAEQLRSEIQGSKGGIVPDWMQGVPGKEKQLADIETELKKASGASEQPDSGMVIAEAKAAISAGADPAAVEQRLRDMGIDPSVLQN